MLMLACKSCGGFPGQIAGAMFSCCELAYIKSINLHDNDLTDVVLSKIWKSTRKYRDAKRMEYWVNKQMFARRARK